MHIRRLITFLLGLWFAMILTVAATATLAFQATANADRAVPIGAARSLSTLGEPLVKQLFRFAAAEVNRAVFERSAYVEVALLFAVAGLLFFQNYSRRATIAAATMLLFACASAFLLTPQVIGQGRILDFHAVGELPAERARFANLHMMYGVMTGGRLLLGAYVTLLLLRRSTPLRRRGSEIDIVDHAEHGHINR